MKIELKKISIYERMSEETTAFNADIYVDGKKAGYAKNEGCGGSTFYSCYNGGRELIEKAELFCTSLPDYDYGNYKVKCDLESYIDNIIENKLIEKDQAKFKKKLNKDMLSGICYGSENSYEKLYWKSKTSKSPFTIEDMLKTTTGLSNISQAVRRLRSEGKTILNTNIPEIN